MEKVRSGTEDEPTRIGLLGGTFDPVHLGHLRAAEETAEALQLEKVFLLPSGTPPHKPGGPRASFEDRLEMVRRGTGESPLLEALDLEGRRAGLSYSIDTLRELSRMMGKGTEIYFIVGLDAFVEMDTWKEYRTLFDYAHFVILQRPGADPGGVQRVLRRAGLDVSLEPRGGFTRLPSGKGISLRPCTSMDISSTRIRTLVGKRRSIRFLVPEAVHRYIEGRRLYRNHENH